MDMTKKNESFPVHLLDNLHTEGAGYDVLRYIALPELFGQESDTLLYFLGRRTARKLEIKTVEDIVHTFKALGWGHLELIKEKNNYLLFHLKSDAVVLRLKASFNTEFRLESGFLAEALEMIKGKTCECTESIHKRIHQIEFKVHYTE